MHCTSCGRPNVDTARFCYSCGAKIEIPPQESHATAPPKAGGSPVPEVPKSAGVATVRPIDSDDPVAWTQASDTSPSVVAAANSAPVSISQASPGRLSPFSALLLILGLVFCALFTLKDGAINVGESVGAALVPLAIAYFFYGRRSHRDLKRFALIFVVIAFLLALGRLL